MIGARSLNAEAHDFSVMKRRPGTEHAGNELHTVDLCHAPSAWRPPTDCASAAGPGVGARTNLRSTAPLGKGGARAERRAPAACRLHARVRLRRAWAYGVWRDRPLALHGRAATI